MAPAPGVTAKPCPAPSAEDIEVEALTLHCCGLPAPAEAIDDMRTDAPVGHRPDCRRAGMAWCDGCDQGEHEFCARPAVGGGHPRSPEYQMHACCCTKSTHPSTRAEDVQ